MRVAMYYAGLQMGLQPSEADRLPLSILLALLALDAEAKREALTRSLR